MRIADKMNYEQVKTNLAKNRTEMAELQNQAATQKRLNKPSDDPLAATRVLAARTDIHGGEQFLKSLSQAKAFLDFSEESLGELANILIRAKELAISQANDASSGPQTRQVTAAEVEQLHDSAVQVGNRKIGDRFLFGGYKTTHAPFDSRGNYHGDGGEIQIAINKEAKVAMNLPGDRVFLGKLNGELSEGSTLKTRESKTAGDGSTSPNSSLAPKANLSLAPSANSGPLTKNGDIKNSRADREPASIQSASSVAAAQRRGFHEGRQDAIDEEQRRQENAAGDPKKNPDIGGSWSAGVNVFHTLQNLEVALRANDKEGVQESLDNLDAAIGQVILARSQLGARSSTITSTSDTLQKERVDSKTLASNLEDVDTFELVTDINKTDSTLKATLATSGKLIQPSLLDFLK